MAYCAQRLFFKRRGAERRICEVPLDLAVLVAERVSGTSSVAHALAFSHAVEALTDTEVPARGEAVRRALAEIERLYNAPRGDGSRVRGRVPVGRASTVRGAQGAAAPARQRNHRQPLPTRRGSPRRHPIDLDAQAVSLIGDTLRDWQADFGRALAVLLKTDSFLDRLVSAGPLSGRDAREFGCVGPWHAVRRRHRHAPRSAYDGYQEFSVARQADGDVMARMEVRFDEVDSC